MKAFEKDDIEKFRKLLKKRRTDVNLHGANGNRPLHIAAGKWKKYHLIPELLEKGAYVDIRNIYQQTPLYFASTYGNLEAINLLVENGANINAEDGDKNTPLLIARKQKRTKTIELLLKLGAKTNDENQ